MGIIQITPRDRFPEKSNPPFAPFWLDPFLVRPIEPLISAIWQSNERSLLWPHFLFSRFPPAMCPRPQLRWKHIPSEAARSKVPLEKDCERLGFHEVMRKIGLPELRILLEARNPDPLSDEKQPGAGVAGFRALHIRSGGQIHFTDFLISRPAASTARRECARGSSRIRSIILLITPQIA